jgi:resuscitation-promoting factor RpfB
LSQHRRRAPAKRRTRRRTSVFLITSITAALAITAGVYTAVLRTGGGADPTAAVVAEIPNSHAAAVLEQERQQMILMDAASQTLSLVSTPKLATRPSPTPSPSAATAGAPGAGTTPAGPPAAPPNPGTAQSIAYNMLSSFGWSPGTQFACLNPLWDRESGWRYNAENASGAYGIPQALPGSKMASAGPDWQTNPATQIKWGLDYIQGRYGTPCGAWSFWEANGWY